MSQSADNLGEYCGTGAWINLEPYIKRDHVNLNDDAGRRSGLTPSSTVIRCAVPDLADAYGLYYNKALFAKAGHHARRRRRSAQLTQDAEKLTQFNPDGSIKVAGFVPTSSFYENAPRTTRRSGTPQWDENGKSSLSSDPAWADYMRWEKQLINFYGTSKLARFLSGAGEEFSPSNDFESGKIAMELDGEWRVAVHQVRPRQHSVRHRSRAGRRLAVRPVRGRLHNRQRDRDPEGRREPRRRVAAGQISGVQHGCDREVRQRARQRADDQIGVVGSCPEPQPRFDTFLKIFANPHTSTDPNTAIGSANQEMLQSFQTKWEDGSVPTSGLESGLKGVDSQIDAQVANSTAGRERAVTELAGDKPASVFSEATHR